MGLQIRKSMFFQWVLRSQNLKRTSIEEQIIAEADVMSNFDNIEGLFEAAYVYEKLSRIEARKSILNKLIRKYKQIEFDKSRKLIQPKYDAILILLQDTN